MGTYDRSTPERLTVLLLTLEGEVLLLTTSYLPPRGITDGIIISRKFRCLNELWSLNTWHPTTKFVYHCLAFCWHLLVFSWKYTEMWLFFCKITEKRQSGIHSQLWQSNWCLLSLSQKQLQTQTTAYKATVFFLALKARQSKIAFPKRWRGFTNLSSACAATLMKSC
jgi:hypothetical protein